ncbi:hypothetical protein HanIR_Chr07g0327791 [Helianthus annuus]|nr:hypothetical protein HanIR_Chr07g0327791 [Helianthus annuus]
MTTSLIPTHNSAVTTNTKMAAHGSTTIPSAGTVYRARKNGRLSGPPKSNA